MHRGAEPWLARPVSHRMGTGTAPGAPPSAAPWHRGDGSASAHSFPAQKFMDWSPNRDTCSYLGRPRTGISGNGCPPCMVDGFYGTCLQGAFDWRRAGVFGELGGPGAGVVPPSPSPPKALGGTLALAATQAGHCLAQGWLRELEARLPAGRGTGQGESGAQDALCLWFHR